MIVATGNVVDDDARQPIPEGKVIQTNIDDVFVVNMKRKIFIQQPEEFVKETKFKTHSRNTVDNVSER